MLLNHQIKSELKLHVPQDAKMKFQNLPYIYNNTMMCTNVCECEIGVCLYVLWSV